MRCISGTARLFVIVADPVEHLRTPQMFNVRFASSGSDAVLVAARVKPTGLAAFVEGLKGVENLGGLIVTIPHKQAVAALCDALSPTARRAGSVNAVRFDGGRLLGENFDGFGMIRGLRDAGHEMRGRSVLLLGSGGAASAIAFALADEGVGRLTIWNRDLGKAERLADGIRKATAVDASADPKRDTRSVDLIINATSLGLHPGDELPIPADRILAKHIVAEAVMSPEDTALLGVARKRGARVHHGKHMLSAQVDAMGQFIGAF